MAAMVEVAKIARMVMVFMMQVALSVSKVEPRWLVRNEAQTKET